MGKCKYLWGMYCGPVSEQYLDQKLLTHYMRITYHWTADLLFDWLQFGQTSKSIVNFERSWIKTSQTVGQPNSDTSLCEVSESQASIKHLLSYALYYECSLTQLKMSKWGTVKLFSSQSSDLMDPPPQKRPRQSLWSTALESGDVWRK